MGTEGRIVYLDPVGGVGTVTAFSASGFTVEQVDTEAACLEQLDTADALVVRADGPDEDVVTLSGRARDLHPELPIVVFASGGNGRFAGEVVAAGADGYVPTEEGPDTLRCRTEALIEQSGTRAERHGLGIGSNSLAVMELSRSFEVRSWNEEASDLFGYDRCEVIGEDITSLLLSEEDKADVQEGWETVLEEKRPGRKVIPCETKSGPTISCEWFVTPLLDGENGVSTVLAFAKDVSSDEKRTIALEALQDSTQELMRSSDAAEIAELVVSATETVLEGPMSTVRIYDPDENTLMPAAVSETLEVASDTVSPIGEGDGLLWDTFQEGESRFVEEASADMVPYELDAGVGSGLLYPLGDHGLLTVATTNGVPIDETDRRLVDVLAATTEAALDRTERERELERTKEIVDSVGDSVYALDQEGHFTMVNEMLLEETGYSRKELLGRHVSALLTDESYERGIDYIGELLSNDVDAVTYEVKVECKEGDVIPAEATTSILQSNGSVEGTVGTVRDISERKRMERELRDRTEKIETLHQIVAMLEECTTESEVYTVTVEAAEQVLDFDECLVDRVDGDRLVTEAASSGVTGTGEQGRALADDLAGTTYEEGTTARYDDIEDREIEVVQPEVRSVLSVPLGDRAVFQALSREPGAFSSKDEELAELLLTHVADALDRLEFEERLRAERDRFVSLFENVPDAVVSTNHDGETQVVERVNPAFESLFGYPEDTIVGEDLDEYIVPAEDREEAQQLNRQGRQGETVEEEVKRRTTEGLRDFMMRVVPIDDEEDSARTFGLYTDITDQKQRQQRLEILNRVLRHDLRNGMNIISGGAEILGEEIEDEEVAQFAEAIKERATELIGLAEKTREVERTLDREEAALGPLDLVECAERAIEKAESSYNVDIECNLAEDVVVRSDEYLENAILHLIENAIEHNDRSEPEVGVTIEESEQEEATYVVSVADNGPGLPEAERELLEENKEITQLRHASGLGLWLVNWVVTESGGRLTFDENEPRGTVVSFTLPAGERPETGTASDGAAASN